LTDIFYSELGGDNVNPLNSYAQLAFDSNCNLSLIYWHINLRERHPNISSLLLPYFSRDLAVFLYEAFSLFERDLDSLEDDLSLLKFRKDIQIMRNNIHQLVTIDTAEKVMTVNTVEGLGFRICNSQTDTTQSM
jgi:hypothetical protein